MNKGEVIFLYKLDLREQCAFYIRGVDCGCSCEPRASVITKWSLSNNAAELMTIRYSDACIRGKEDVFEKVGAGGDRLRCTTIKLGERGKRRGVLIREFIDSQVVLLIGIRV
jgi:hypothetical protein